MAPSNVHARVLRLKDSDDPRREENITAFKYVPLQPEEVPADMCASTGASIPNREHDECCSHLLRMIAFLPRLY